jgi:rubrerythrin
MTHQESHDFPSQQAIPGYPWDTDLHEPGFMRDVFPPSTWDDLALVHIDEHIATEAKAGAAYDALAEADDPQIKYLAALIAADERRHHQMLSDIARALRAEVSEQSDEGALAKGGHLSTEQATALLHETQQLLALEKNDVGELKKLHREFHPASDETIWPLLIEIMELDTEKHIRILKGIERHLTRRRWPH